MTNLEDVREQKPLLPEMSGGNCGEFSEGSARGRGLEDLVKPIRSSPAGPNWPLTKPIVRAYVVFDIRT